MKEFGYINADIVIRENITVDRFIDAIKGNRVYVNAITVLNKVDLVGEEKAAELAKQINADITISAEKKENLEKLRKTIWANLGLIRIYMKEPGKEADMKEPLIVDKGSSIEEACKSIHQDFAAKFKFARVWGKSAKFDGQKLMKGHVMAEGDILELHFI